VEGCPTLLGPCAEPLARLRGGQLVLLAQPVVRSALLGAGARSAAADTTGGRGNSTAKVAACRGRCGDAAKSKRRLKGDWNSAA